MHTNTTAKTFAEKTRFTGAKRRIFLYNSQTAQIHICPNWVIRSKWLSRELIRANHPISKHIKDSTGRFYLFILTENHYQLSVHINRRYCELSVFRFIYIIYLFILTENIGSLSDFGFIYIIYLFILTENIGWLSVFGVLFNNLSVYINRKSWQIICFGVYFYRFGVGARIWPTAVYMISQMSIRQKSHKIHTNHTKYTQIYTKSHKIHTNYTKYTHNQGGSSINYQKIINHKS